MPSLLVNQGGQCSSSSVVLVGSMLNEPNCLVGSRNFADAFEIAKSAPQII
jgi:hypothetical protein